MKVQRCVWMKKMGQFWTRNQRETSQSRALKANKCHFPDFTTKPPMGTQPLWVSRILRPDTPVSSLFHTDVQLFMLSPRYKYHLIYSIYSKTFFIFNKSCSVEQLGTWGRCYVPAPLNVAEQFERFSNISGKALRWDSNLEKPLMSALWCIIYGSIREIKSQDNCGTECCAKAKI